MVLRSRFPYRKIAWAVFLTPVGGCVGLLLLMAFWLIAGELRLTSLRDARLFLALALFGAVTFGSMYAAPVTLVVLPVVRYLRPGRDRFSLFLLALAGVVFGFLSPAGMIFLAQKASSFVRMENVLGFGAVGAGSGLIMAAAWFYLTQPPPGDDPAPLDWRSVMGKLTNVTEVIAYIAAHALGMAFALLGGTAAVFAIARSYGFQNPLLVSLTYSIVVMLVVMLLFFVFRAVLSPTKTRPE